MGKLVNINPKWAGGNGPNEDFPEYLEKAFKVCSINFEPPVESP